VLDSRRTLRNRGRIVVVCWATLIVVSPIGCGWVHDPVDRTEPAPSSGETDPLAGIALVPPASGTGAPSTGRADPGADRIGEDPVPAGPGPVDPVHRTRPSTRGDDPGLDELWTRCEGGDGTACDELFDTAPVGSDYERFGLSCGDRPTVIDCVDLSPSTTRPG
jgi:hypothetical protein